MKEQLIGIKVAKLAKEKLFNWMTNDCYDSNGHTYLNGWCERLDDFFEDNNFINSEIESKNIDSYYTAPTQSLLQRWLREEYDIHIVIDVNMEFFYKIYDSTLGNKAALIQEAYFGEGDKITYEESLEEALIIALESIK